MMAEARQETPTADVSDAFGAVGQPERLSAGRHPTWRIGDVVLKSVDISEEQLSWQTTLQERLQGYDGFRVPQIIPANEGQLVIDGWYAMTFLSGRHEPGRWLDIIDVGDVFHGAVAAEPAPPFLGDRTDPWSIGDRVAWGELSPDDVPPTKHLDRLLGALASVDGRSQLVHGDLNGNVLFDDHLRPAVLDLSPYYRPTPFASAVVVADALVWEGADEALVSAFEGETDFPQYLLRALIYRIVTDRLFRLDEPLRPDDDDPYAKPVDTAVRLTGR